MLKVNRKRKEFKITTDVYEIDGIKGGTISGEDESLYETVTYGEDATKTIVAIPDEGYEVALKTYGKGNFMLQLCSEGEKDYSQRFHTSRVVF